MTAVVALAATGVVLVVMVALVALLRDQGGRIRLPGMSIEFGRRHEAPLDDKGEPAAAPPPGSRLREGLRLPPMSVRLPAPTERVPQPRPPIELLAALAREECVLFAGSGVAASAGFPTWRELLGVLVDEVERGSGEATARALHLQLEAGQSELVAQVVSGRLSPEAARRAIRDALALHSPHGSPLLEELRRVRFAGVITDEFSDIVRRAFAVRQPIVLTSDARDAAGTLRTGRFFVLHAYGSVEFDETLCLSFDDYQRRLDESRDLALFVGALMATRTLLFVGTSLVGVEQFCVASGVRGSGSRRHYALVPAQPGFEFEQERLGRRYGVTLLPYDPEPEHAAVTTFAAALRNAERGRARMAPVRSPDQLERIALRNVGPFEQVELECTRPWNVLLGDNAVGKTTVLRAVALALSGESPATTVAPERLLRSGASHGEIEVTFGGATYRTVLRRERDQVRADSEQVTPVQSGSWLAVGVPALRGVSQRTLHMPSHVGAVEPSSSDILPLLHDGLDARIDDLKGWIAAHWLRSRDSSSSEAKRHGLIIERFFRVLRSLTPGVEFEFREIAADGRVVLHSVDGEISIDDLSLGMSAMIGGIGVLLQRLYEVYPDDPNPERRNALLLVDEIDAHLHPDWQARLLPTLRTTLPGLHLFATTHSALVAVNAEAGELHHLRRERTGIVAERIDERFDGWRADQVLTGPAFDLDTTMDRRTADKLMRYRRLQSSAELGPDEREDLVALARELELTMPSPHETPDQREASRLLEEWLDERLREQLTPERRERLADETQAELARLHRLGREER